MPLTEDLRPGKFVSVLGQPNLLPPVAPSYNGTLNKFGVSPNNTEQFKVFQDINGVKQSMNQTLINQDTYSSTKNNLDLQNALRSRYIPNAFDEYDLLPDAYQYQFKRPGPFFPNRS